MVRELGPPRSSPAPSSLLPEAVTNFSVCNITRHIIWAFKKQVREGTLTRKETNSNLKNYLLVFLQRVTWL